jgi:predicted HTH transcriptional regulator
LVSRPRNVVEDVVEDVVENRQNLLEMIKENDTISAKSISEQIKVSERNVQRILEKLKKENIIYREGSPKGGRWIIL